MGESGLLKSVSDSYSTAQAREILYSRDVLDNFRFNGLPFDMAARF